MEGIDFVILLGVIFYVILGFRDGFMKKVFGIIGFWGGLVLAGKFMTSVGGWIYASVGFSHDTSFVLAFAAIFTCISVMCNVSFRWFGVANSNTMTVKARFGGGVLGLAQGILAVSLLMVMLSVFEMPSEESKKDALFFEITADIAPMVFDASTAWIPDSRAFVNEVMEKFEKFRPVEE